MGRLISRCALFPIGAAFFVSAIVVAAPIALDAHSLPNRVSLKIDVAPADRCAKFEQMGFSESILEFNKPDCASNQSAKDRASGFSAWIAGSSPAMTIERQGASRLCPKLRLLHRIFIML